MFNRFALVLIMLMSAVSLADSAPNERTLFTFSKPDSASQWQTVNDGVMGGRSDGRFRINDDGHLEFFGNLSLANNGGFASVRSRGVPLKLSGGDTIAMKVRGDGREYSLNLYTARGRTAFSYRAMFQTTKEEWTEVKVPLSKFQATSFGRIVRGQSLNPGEVTGLGILLGDRKSGPFRLEVASVKVVSE